MQDAHDLRRKLLADPDLNPIYVSMFLQGSHARHTRHQAVWGGHARRCRSRGGHDPRPPDEDARHGRARRFRPFLDREYPGQWERNDRSILISPTGWLVTLDLV